ncbi:peptidase [Gordonia oryzae]|uniref:Peptidase n=1 Tax=Gordonia oryzae TaxID=2487349 RepID=A0A3N4G9N6_9ACTN|nr:peptidase [Gordonia oryzae]RPA59469.1 peptidase [Gordonia oryzae]
MQSTAIGLTPVHQEGELNGILISGRWPESTLEWTQTLVASVRIACRPGFLPTTTIFGVVEERPEKAADDAVGMMVAVGNVVDDSFLEAGRFLTNPPALLMLHPPSRTRPSLPECSQVASGCVLLPGLPELGLEHRAGWAEAEADGTVVNLRNQVGIDPGADPDTAVLAMLLAA